MVTLAVCRQPSLVPSVFTGEVKLSRAGAWRGGLTAFRRRTHGDSGKDAVPALAGSERGVSGERGEWAVDMAAQSDTRGTDGPSMSPAASWREEEGVDEPGDASSFKYHPSG